MTIGEICNREVVLAARDTPVVAAAKLMRQYHVGTVVVFDGTNGDNRIPVGIVSIDDLLEVLAEQMTDLTKIVSREQAHEAQARR
ncbi:MAG: CBS domain-containing protein [Betaproteobacteria bacterium]|nr:CBS domain-containing protein [Betaproteobacteria bacterium]